MSTHANQANGSPNRASSVRDTVTFTEIVSIGATGAPSFGTNDSDDPGITISRSGTGAYSLTFPKGKRVWIAIALVSAAKTVVAYVITAQDATAGTATFKTLAGTNAAADTDPASGDKLMLVVMVER